MTSKPEISSKRIVSVQVCRGLAAMLVVLAHLHSTERKYCTTDHLRFFQHGVLGVDLFFAISGVVISSVVAGRFHSARNAASFLYHRFTRIFPIYWIYTSIVLAAVLYQPQWVNAEGGHHANILASYLLIPTHSPMLLLQGWTLTSEFYFYLVFALLMLLVSERGAAWLLGAWSIAVVGLKLWIGLSPYPLVNTLISPSILEFLAGCVIYQIYRRANLRRSAGVLLVLSSVIWLAAIVAYYAHVHPGDAKIIEDSPWLRPLLYGSFSAVFLLGAIELERSGLVRYFRVFEAIGDHSYSIYLSHIIVIELVARTLYHFGHGWLDSIFLIALISLPAVLLVGYLSYVYLEKLLMARFYRPKPPVPQPSGIALAQ